MLINGVDLSSLGVQLYDRIITSNHIETTQDWLEGDIQPTYIRQQDRFKNITLQFLITETDENAVLDQPMQGQKSAKADVISGEIMGDAHYHSQERAQEKWEAADGSQSATTGWLEMQPDGKGREEKTERNAANAVLVHLNSATETDLIQLPGVGNATARRILAFRNQHGFQRIEDIMQVPGIGPAKFARMKRCLAL